jgi:uncharacterized DUF497 family protein
MNIQEAMSCLREISEIEYKDKINSRGLPEDRQDLLFRFIHGEIHVNYSCKSDIESYAIKILRPDLYEKIEIEINPYSKGPFHEYDPPKNGQNIIKHGLGFNEVMSYSPRFGTLQVPIPNDDDGERRVLFSDFQLDGASLTLPLSDSPHISYTVSITHYRENRFRFISSRFMSSDKKEYERTVNQVLRDTISDKSQRKLFVKACIEIIERDLINSSN